MFISPCRAIWPGPPSNSWKTLERALSGCIRLGNDTMRWLVGRIGPGVPVTITG